MDTTQSWRDLPLDVRRRTVLDAAREARGKFKVSAFAAQIGGNPKTAGQVLRGVVSGYTGTTVDRIAEGLEAWGHDVYTAARLDRLFPGLREGTAKRYVLPYTCPHGTLEELEAQEAEEARRAQEPDEGLPNGFDPTEPPPEPPVQEEIPALETEDEIRSRVEQMVERIRRRADLMAHQDLILRLATMAPTHRLKGGMAINNDTAHRLATWSVVWAEQVVELAKNNDTDEGERP